MHDELDHPEMIFGPLRRPLAADAERRLREALDLCPDVAFAHLVEVEIPAQEQGGPALFVWLRAEAMRSLKGALNLVSEAVARSIPENRFMDVLILNSAPELLLPLEEAGCLFVEPSPEERLRALAAARTSEGDAEPADSGRLRRWWPF